MNLMMCDLVFPILDNFLDCVVQGRELRSYLIKWCIFWN